jgi:hypothetical protein
VTDSTAPLDSPVPRKGVVFELLRSGLIIGGLLGATLLFAIVDAWIIAGIILVITILGAMSGAVLHPRQLTSAMRPKSVSVASATPVARHKQAWLMLDDKSGRTLAVELRSRRFAKSIGQQSVPVTIAGQLDPGQWIVVQTMSMTIWPASKVEEGMPRGASYDLKRMTRSTWRDMMK